MSNAPTWTAAYGVGEPPPPAAPTPEPRSGAQHRHVLTLVGRSFWPPKLAPERLGGWEAAGPRKRGAGDGE